MRQSLYHLIIDALIATLQKLRDMNPVATPSAELAALLKKCTSVSENLSAAPDLAADAGAPEAPSPLLAEAEGLRARGLKYPGPLILLGSYYGTKFLIVGGSEPIPLGMREFVYIKVLKSMAGQFVKMEDLLEAIRKENTGLTNEDGSAFWQDPSSQDIYKLNDELRTKIESAGGVRTLIETAEGRGAGVRLSCPPDRMEEINDGN